MKDLEWAFGSFYIRIQRKKPFLMKKWQLSKIDNHMVKGWAIHLCPLHIHYEIFK